MNSACSASDLPHRQNREAATIGRFTPFVFTSSQADRRPNKSFVTPETTSFALSGSMQRVNFGSQLEKFFSGRVGKSQILERKVFVPTGKITSAILVGVFALFSPAFLVAQVLTPGDGPVEVSPSDAISAPAANPDSGEQGGRQTKRIIGLIPNFQAVSADTELPPLSFKQKFWLSTQGSFDYSSFAFVGIQAGVEQAFNTYPEFHSGAAAYGRYYWHTFADQAVGNYIAGTILPTITREDPRYYTLYHGTFFHRTIYALSRVVITRKDSGERTFNYSEILGNGIATEVSSRYYPHQERDGEGEFCERWISQILNDGISNVFEEFWPDINRKFFHQH